MSLGNCVRCGKLFAHHRASAMACTNCYTLHESEFLLSKDYLRDHPTASLDELSQQTGIPRHRLLDWIREGRIQIL